VRVDHSERASPAVSVVLGFISDSWYGQGGTANYVLIRIAILNASHSVLIKAGAAGHQSVTMGIANTRLHISTSLTAGSYSLVIQYVMQGGAVTTFNDLVPQLDVYQMGADTTPV
jgi:hypothetical protein